MILSHSQTKRAFAPKIRSKILKKWDKLTESDLEKSTGSFKKLIKKIQETYKINESIAERECLDFKFANKLAH
jgi:hypothetical protein